ncbi:MAG: flagellar hook-basal body protein [Clostridiales bacterium]|nr:flagellar hook-basal body protein [Clostridiales bacterium]
MVRGLYTSGVGMMAVMRKFDVISDNIANADTTGFKKDTVITRSFSEELMKRLDDPASNQTAHSVRVGRVSLGVFVDTLNTNFGSGAIRITDNEFDLAINGDGFFTIGTTDENGEYAEKYSRDGSLTVRNGLLVTKDGNTVLGLNGVITLPEGEFTVSEAGEVRVNGEYIDTLRMTSFTDNQTLRKYKDNLYSTTPESELTNFQGRVQQGALEASNVNSISEMVDMITVNRLYEANQRVITTIDTTLGRAVNDISRK